MNLYKITFRSGRTSIVEEERSLSNLAADLAQDGFVVVRRQASGYSPTKTEVAVMERAVESIEPTAE
jgi:Holliday junction resolvase